MADDAQFRDWAASARGWMRRSAFLLSLDWHLADDLVQEVLIKMYAKFRRIDPAKRDAYARRALTTTFLDSTRRPWRREISVEEFRDEPVALPPEMDMEPGAATRALAVLPAGQRAVIVLRYFLDLSVEQAAATLRLSEGTIKSQCARGLARLRDELTRPASAGQEVDRK